MRRKTCISGTIVVLAGGCAGVLWAPQASAAQIVVNFSSSTVTAPNIDDGKCDIVEAVQAANTDTAIHTNDCPAGGGSDEIVLSLNAVYRVNQTLRLTSDTTFTVSNGGRATIKPANSWIMGSQLGGDCVMYADTDTVVNVNNVNFTGNNNSGVTGFGTAGYSTLKRVSVTDFLNSGVIGWCTSERHCAPGSSELHIESSTIAGNYAPQHGGGVAFIGDFNTPADLVIDNSLITDNSSDWVGGGIFIDNAGGTHRITNSTISGNYAVYGGGISTSFGDTTRSDVAVQVFNSTIAYNQADERGGGIWHHSSGRILQIFASLAIGNTAVAQPNVGWDFRPPECFDNSIVYIPPGNGTLIQADVAGEQCRFDIVPPGTENTVIGPLMPMGGTEVPVYPLIAGSPAIDAVVTSTLLTQQRDNFTEAQAPGQPGWMLWDRNVDGDSNGTARRDVGAYEYNLRWQTELLPVKEVGSGVATLTTVVASGWDRGAGILYSGTSAVNRFITQVIPLQDAAPRKVKVGYRRTSTGGKYQLAVADSASGPWTNVGGVKETYGTTSAFLEHDITGSGSVSFAGPGIKYFRFTVVARPAGEAGGYDLNLDYIRVTP